MMSAPSSLTPRMVEIDLDAANDNLSVPNAAISPTRVALRSELQIA
jgi:hypothetical protein